MSTDTQIPGRSITHSGTWFKVSVVLFVVLPSFLLILSELSSTTIAYDIVKNELLLFTFFVGVLYVLDFLGISLLRLAAVFSMGSYYFLSYAFILYRLLTGADFNVRILSDNSSEVFPTLIKIFGPLVMTASLFIALFAWAVFVTCMSWTQKRISGVRQVFDRSWRSPLLAILLVLLTGISVHNAPAKASSTETTEAIEAVFPDTSELKTSSSDSIFYLQLESGNATIVNTPMKIGQTEFKGGYNPTMRSIAKDGVYFPFFWGNNMMTIRSQESIFCGITGNMQKAFANRIDDIRSECLPALLKKSGYRTLFFQTYPDLEFANSEKFLEKIGFDEVHGQDILKENIPLYEWGYDDCSYYRAVFTYLKEARPKGEKLFVYIAASTHHTPYNPRDLLKFTHPFKETSHSVQKYLNSYAEQDYCSGVFYDEYKAYKNSQTHLFLGPDHSVPLWGHNGGPMDQNGSYPEHFFVDFAYIPSDEKKELVAVGAERKELYGQTDLLWTIFDILNNTSSEHSFAQTLRKEKPPASETCQILIQPYGTTAIAIAENGFYYRYLLKKKTLEVFNLKTDPQAVHPFVLSTDMPFSTFKKQYYCKDQK